jgi:hypothetical protein
MAPDRKKQTYFNHDWLKNKEDGFDIWLQTGSNKISFRCRVCNGTKDLALGQAGVGSLKKHANGDSHKKNLSIHMKTLNFFKPPTLSLSMMTLNHRLRLVNPRLLLLSIQTPFFDF